MPRPRARRLSASDPTPYSLGVAVTSAFSQPALSTRSACRRRCPTNRDGHVSTDSGSPSAPVAQTENARHVAVIHVQIHQHLVVRCRRGRDPGMRSGDDRRGRPRAAAARHQPARDQRSRRRVAHVRAHSRRRGVLLGIRRGASRRRPVGPDTDIGLAAGRRCLPVAVGLQGR